MGRPVKEIKKENTKIRIRADLKQAAKDHGLNFSKVMEDALIAILKKIKKN